MTYPVTSSISCTIESSMLTENKHMPHSLQVGTVTLPYNNTGTKQANKKNYLLLLKEA